ncbi:hypothetical protein QOT17_019463 [Balamuthia mandrillaris]
MDWVFYNDQHKGNESTQANERTFEAWTRTSLGCIVSGVLIARFNLFMDKSHIGALCYVAIGALCVLISSYRYYHVFHLLQRGHFQPNKWGILVLSVFTFVATLISLFLVLLEL